MMINQKFTNFAFSVQLESGFITADHRQTQIRVIDADPQIIEAIKACQTTDDICHLLYVYPNRFQLPPVGLIGPKEASAGQYQMAEQFGEIVAGLGLTVICGGRNGVMEAVCKGVHSAGGRSIGLLPGDDWREANPYVTLPVVTNMGPTRNSLIAKTAFALVAVGGGYGTLTEMAYGLHYGKPVVATSDAPYVEGATCCDDLETLVAHVLTALFRP